MKAKQFIAWGIPAEHTKLAIQCLQRAIQAGVAHGKQEVAELVRRVAQTPQAFIGDPCFGPLATEMSAVPATARPPLEYTTWGNQIDPAAHQQMRTACQVPAAVGAALMPDAHVGYGLPIGGVLACDSIVIPYAVGVDIACRMKLTVLDLPVETFESRRPMLARALENGTRFGVGSENPRRQSHSVMDQDWTVSRVVRENKDKAWKQLGTSGSGNHFVEFGLLTLTAANAEWELPAGQYVALLSHSGSRGTGAAVCSTYSQIARQQLPKQHTELSYLAWLDLDSEAGQEYWNSMNLMGDYAAANHALIHQNVSALTGGQTIAGVENHHNFAWIESHQGRDLVVHRKGATPAGAGVWGVIPGSMGDPAFVVRGKGVPESFSSASHGAGRCMSRTQAKSTYRFSQIRNELAARGIDVLSAGSDEVPGVYKNILEVMAEQRDLVDIIARFDPKIVKMCGDGSRAED